MSLDVYLHAADGRPEELYRDNITHNLAPMAKAALVYWELWRPDEVNITTAGQLVKPLRAGLARLRRRPARYRAFSPENGWGDYDGLCAFVADYLAACEANPDASVWVSR